MRERTPWRKPTRQHAACGLIFWQKGTVIIQYDIQPPWRKPILGLPLGESAELVFVDVFGGVDAAIVCGFDHRFTDHADAEFLHICYISGCILESCGSCTRDDTDHDCWRVMIHLVEVGNGSKLKATASSGDERCRGRLAGTRHVRWPRLIHPASKLGLPVGV